MVVLVEIVNIKQDKEFATILEWMEGRIKILVGNTWIEVTVKEFREEEKALFIV